MIEAFAAQAAAALHQERLAAQAAVVEPLAEVDRLRAALLSAAGNDLRAPLASARVAIAGLRGAAGAGARPDRDEPFALAEAALDRLDRRVDDLIDMSHLQAGVLSVSPRLVSLAEAVPAAVEALGDAGRTVVVQVPDDLPEIRVDAALFERALVNLVSSAVHRSPPGRPPTVVAGEYRGRAEIRVVDHGQGPDRDRVTPPHAGAPVPLAGGPGAGSGVGLALARGLIDAMGGTLATDPTPGGGLTTIVSMPAAPPRTGDADQNADPAVLDRLEHWPAGGPGPAGGGPTAPFRQE